MTRHPVTYDGELVAIAGANRFWLIGGWLEGRRPDDPLMRFVTYMCLWNGEIEAGRVEGPFTSELAETWARLALVDDDVLLSESAQPDHELAHRMNVPVEQLAKRRIELGVSRAGK
jgi:hypothetical protein